MFTHRWWRRLITLATGLFLGSLVCGGFLMSSSATTHEATVAVAHADAGQ